MSIKIELTKLKFFIKALATNKLLTTARKKPFTVSVLTDGLEFVPESSNKPRKETDKNLTKVIANFNATSSFVPKDYHDMTYNSVYILKVIEIYISQLKN